MLDPWLPPRDHRSRSDAPAPAPAKREREISKVIDGVFSGIAKALLAFLSVGLAFEWITLTEFALLLIALYVGPTRDALCPKGLRT